MRSNTMKIFISFLLLVVSFPSMSASTLSIVTTTMDCTDSVSGSDCHVVGNITEFDSATTIDIMPKSLVPQVPGYTNSGGTLTNTNKGTSAVSDKFKQCASACSASLEAAHAATSDAIAKCTENKRNDALLTCSNPAPGSIYVTDKFGNSVEQVKPIDVCCSNTTDFNRLEYINPDLPIYGCAFSDTSEGRYSQVCIETSALQTPKTLLTPRILKCKPKGEWSCGHFVSDPDHCVDSFLKNSSDSSLKLTLNEKLKLSDYLESGGSVVYESNQTGNGGGEIVGCRNRLSETNTTIEETYQSCMTECYEIKNSSTMF